MDPRSVPRTLIVVAHPDDEVLALGGRLARHKQSLFVHVTDGAPLDEADSVAHGFSTLAAYRQARRNELEKAFIHGDIPHVETVNFEVPDQRAIFHLGSLTSRLVLLLREYAPELILTHPYEGGHPDHDACAVIVQRAVQALEEERRPVIAEATFYHQGPSGIETGCFLPEPSGRYSVTRILTARESRRKQELLACFSTQKETLSYFSSDVERYRIAPTYDFSRPPHEGVLFYEKFPWGMTGEKFREIVRTLCIPEAAVCN